MIAVFQGPVVLGDAEANLAATLQAMEQSAEEGADILAMPETFLHGYFPQEAQARRNAIGLSGPVFADMLERFKKFETTLLLGLNELRGGKLFNTVAVIERGRLLGKYSKNFPVYNYFERGHEFPVFEKNGVKYGIVICADTSYIEPARILAMKGAQILFTPHFNYIAYDGLEDHTWRVRQHHAAIAIDNDVYVARSNVVVPESQGADHFGYRGVGVGDSLILNRRGRVLAEAGICTQRILIQEIPDDDLKPPRRRPWQRVSPQVATALHEQYQEMFATHADVEFSAGPPKNNAAGE